jgi:hypothetical protein
VRFKFLEEIFYACILLWRGRQTLESGASILPFGAHYEQDLQDCTSRAPYQQQPLHNIMLLEVSRRRKVLGSARRPNEDLQDNATTRDYGRAHEDLQREHSWLKIDAHDPSRTSRLSWKT